MFYLNFCSNTLVPVFGGGSGGGNIWVFAVVVVVGVCQEVWMLFTRADIAGTSWPAGLLRRRRPAGPAELPAKRYPLPARGHSEVVWTP